MRASCSTSATIWTARVYLDRMRSMETLTFLPEFHRYWLGREQEYAYRRRRRRRRRARRLRCWRARWRGAGCAPCWSSVASWASEASRAAAGMVAPQAEIERPGPLLPLGSREPARATRSWVAQLQAESGIDVEYRTDGILYVALDDAGSRALAARARWQRRARSARDRRSRRAAARRMAPSLPPRITRAAHFPDDHRVNNERLAVAAGLAARVPE